MKKSHLLSSLLFFTAMSSLVYADDLIVGNGETYLIKENQRELHLKKLILGDKAVIQFADGVTYWDVSADEVEIGNEVVIDGRGKEGATGVATLAFPGRAEDCKNGAPGANGSIGVSGANGVDIQMRLTVSKLGSMKINVGGGKGGIGGNGIQGQQGGLAKNCDSTQGGNGGNGGRGGNGGNGGKLIVSLNSRTSTQSLMAISHLIEASAEGGRGATGGNPGEGGEGSEGKFINQKTLTGDKKWISGGKKGDKGVEGEKGNDGHEGRVFIGGGELNVTPIQQESVHAITKSPMLSDENKDLQELKAQIQSLEKRVEQLEKNKN